jgi:hypothetical protein
MPNNLIFKISLDYIINLLILAILKDAKSGHPDFTGFTGGRLSIVAYLRKGMIKCGV